MRVLFTTTPGLGHVHPMLPLARAFLERGDEVAWAAAAEVRPRIEREGFDVMTAGIGEAEGIAEFRRRFPEVDAIPPAERPDFMFPRVFGAVRAPPMLAAVLPLVRTWEPSLVVHDQGDLAAPIAAAAIGVPNVCHSFGRLLPPGRVADAGQQVAPLWEAQGMEPRPYAGSYDHLYLSIYPESLDATDTAHVPQLQRLRPVVVATGGDAPLPAWVGGEGDAPLVYVTFGTVFNRDVGLIGAVVEGVRQLPVKVVVTLGPGRPPDVLGEQPPNVHVAAYVPQTQLLPHCAVVVSHAGSGTVLATLGLGLPQLCLPQAADQFGNATACARSGVGLALQPGTVTPEAVRTSVEQLLSEPRFRAAAEGVAGEIRAMPGPAEVADVVADRFGPPGA